MDDQAPQPDAAERRRRAAFKEMVRAQDRGVGARESRALVARNHGLTAAEVQGIELEGIDGDWPPR